MKILNKLKGMMPGSNLKVSTKLIIALVVPLTGAAYFAAEGAINNYKAYRQASIIEELSFLAKDVGAAVHELQKERGASAGFISNKGKNGFSNTLESQYKDSDEKIASLYKSMQSTMDKYSSTVFIDKVSVAKKYLKTTLDLRSKVLSNSVPVGDMAKAYTDSISKLLDIVAYMAITDSDSEVSNNITAYLVMLQVKETAGQERAMGAAGFGKDQFPYNIHKQFMELMAQQNGFMNMYRYFATPEQLEFTLNAVPAKLQKEIDGLRHVAIESTTVGSNFGVTSSEWFEKSTKRINHLKTVEDRLVNDLLKSAENVRLSSYNIFLIDIALIVIIFMMAAISVLWVSLSLSVTLRNIIREFDNKVSLKFASILAMADGLGGISSSMEETSQNTTNKTRQVMAHSSEAAASVSSVAAALEEMISSVEEVSRGITDTAELTCQAESKAESSKEVLTNLENATERVSGMAHSIRELADRTNLLALNAAIESARAGEAGRGFAVVAEEVKKLANATNTTTAEIEQEILAIQRAVSDTSETLNSINSAILQIRDQSNTISATAQEQGAVAAEISHNMTNTSGLVAQVDENIRHVEEANETTNMASVNVASAVDAMRMEVSSVQGEIAEVSNAIRKV